MRWAIAALVVGLGLSFIAWSRLDDASLISIYISEPSHSRWPVVSYPLSAATVVYRHAAGRHRILRANAGDDRLVVVTMAAASTLYDWGAQPNLGRLGELMHDLVRMHCENPYMLDKLNEYLVKQKTLSHRVPGSTFEPAVTMLDRELANCRAAGGAQ